MSGSSLPSLGSRGQGWVLIQLLLLGAVAGVGARGPRWPPRARSGLRIGATALGSAGAAMMIGGSAALGKSLTPNPRPRDDSVLEEGGVFAIVRHPIYGGVVLGALAWSLWLSPAALLPTAVTGAFLDLKSRREETWLKERYPSYETYRARVRSRMLPLVW